MYYFLNESLPVNGSGIEHAEVKRLNLFKNFGVKAKIITRNFDRLAHSTLSLYGLKDSDYLNMFDYFAGTTHYRPRIVTVESLKIPDIYTMNPVKDGYEVFDHERKVMRIYLFQNEKQLDSVEYFNADNHTTKQDFYDYRGFNSLTKFFDTADGHLVYEQFHRPDGSNYYEVSYEKSPNNLVATNLQLINFNGADYSLMNMNQLFTMMLDDVNTIDGKEPSTFISDRSNITNVPMIDMKTNAKKIEHFHSIHFRDYWDPMNSPLTYPSIKNNELLSRTDLVIVTSEQQKNDMKKRLKTKVPIEAIPAGSIPNRLLKTKHIDIGQREQGKIIAVARLFYEKRLDDTIKAFNMAYQKNSNLTLDIYGYGDSRDNYKEEKMLKNLVNSLNLQSVVKFMGYTRNIDEVYNNAQLMIVSSRFEAGPLSIVEGQAHGVPAIAYNINYGPAYLINNHHSGLIVPDGDMNALASGITNYFNDQNQQIKMNEAAYENAKRFSQENVWKIWQKYVVK
ncbi:glycosyltransferase [Apilactobacillus apisilvae]|uniref:Glycosyltransferase n=1 Tax=Apilactobacillus apisilvae TaxID=2923364 RepID=A0ABY4PHJ6_9LACO|nr:glycosyltransferase [Apilactobacillus apisilvae]UQS84936.1 glycosyltransferase [Apilactobacillus apisilvae]